ncbi:MAG TPA: inositol monophosphatase [Segeticoccus sp.]|uniref:inositol monophosphatase family protein n=1 Tax=Segeticoccus sp. TaxID=2706531 RepID=UPI002D7F4813|nr:inositol monophosphatase [Segeticoccus sp.]HET8601087.1 inositol monophosphatase [Segeticoccus sp.]
MDTDAVLQLLKDTAEAVINPRFQALSKDQVEEKHPGDLVTVADRESEELLTKALLADDPDALVVGEEAVDQDPSILDALDGADHAWTVDPVDGTKNFVAGSPDHAVMVAELRSGQVVRGWIWQPQHEQAYVAERGAGAECNGVRISRPLPAGEPGQLRGATSYRKLWGAQIGQLEPLGPTHLCCGIDYGRLASGLVDFLVYRRAKPWDHAPGSLIATESGGRVGRADGSDYDPRTRQHGLLAAGSSAAFATALRQMGRSFTEL